MEANNNIIVEYLDEDTGVTTRKYFSDDKEAISFLKSTRKSRCMRSTPLEKYELLTSFHHEEKRMKFKDYWVGMVNYCNKAENVANAVVNNKPVLYATQLIVALSPTLKELRLELDRFFDRCIRKGLPIPQVSYTKLSDAYLISPSVKPDPDVINKETENLVCMIDIEEARALGIEIEETRKILPQQDELLGLEQLLK